MNLLLDECLPVDLRHSFSNHSAHSVQWAGLKGKQNGELLRLAEAAGYDVLITVNQGIPYQQPLAGRKIAVIAVQSRTNQIEDLLPIVESILRALESIRPGQILAVARDNPYGTKSTS
jgi:predicted nuclease of predicted toxin-antitoxin system